MPPPLLAHVAGVPLEELFLPLLPVAAALVVTVRSRLPRFGHRDDIHASLDANDRPPSR
jgi:hypothetical protein